ncbi:MAG TPA: regulatory protein RecX [Nitrospirota bacterium]|nr:regulatory protein RecX [Nitrospirota bacterium]
MALTADLNEKERTRARNAAYRLLTYRPRSHAELEQKLRERQFNEAVIEFVLADLERLGYVNDRQFAGQWAAGRLRLRGFGRRRIEQELRRKGISHEVIREAINEAVPAEDEREAAVKAAEKKLRTMQSVGSDVRRRRLAGFLERKGFSSEITRSIINLVR